jgi:acyl carrier protein
MNEKVARCIYAAVDEANLDRDGKPPLERSLDTPIHGSESGLDSLGLINFIVAVEENLEREFDVVLVLGDDRALEHDPSPFTSIAALAAYVETLLAEQKVT